MPTDRWVERLQPGHPEREAALEELRAVLLRGLSKSLARRGGGEAFAEDVVQQALVRVLEKLDSFDGRSKLTTWAMSIAVRLAITELRRRHFQDVSLDQIRREKDLQFASPDGDHNPAPDAQRAAVLDKLRQLIDAELTERQRTAIQAILAGLPAEEIGRRIKSNRNAVYKLIHDARTRLRRGFEESGFSAEDIHAALP